jgi:hypothetical protein
MKIAAALVAHYALTIAQFQRRGSVTICGETCQQEIPRLCSVMKLPQFLVRLSVGRIPPREAARTRNPPETGGKQAATGFAKERKPEKLAFKTAKMRCAQTAQKRRLSILRNADSVPANRHRAGSREGQNRKKTTHQIFDALLAGLQIHNTPEAVIFVSLWKDTCGPLPGPHVHHSSKTGLEAYATLDGKPA